MTKSPLELRLAAQLESRRAKSKFRQLKASPPDSVDFSSNDFLSLSTNPTYREDYLALLNKSNFALGSTGSRLLDGNSKYAEELENEIASFHGAEAGLLTNSGYDANVSIFTCLPQPGDIILYDELIHASVHDGMRQSRAKQTIPFKHNNVADLQKILTSLLTSMTPTTNIFIAVESVYSMDGDIAPLKAMSELITTLYPSQNAHLIVDEAHATGIYGPNGSGLVNHLNLESKITVRLHTFGKALAAHGAIILCSHTLRSYLINYARPLIYTTFMSYPSLVAIKTAYTWLQSGQTVPLAANLNRLIEHLHTRLLMLPSTDQLTIASECPSSPIFALLSRHPRQLAEYCQKAGFLVRAVMSPTVPKGTERVRVCLHAGNTVDQVDRFVQLVGEWVSLQGREMGIHAKL